eukprot:ANDGO_03045.mRNA.1 Uncharacterized protein C18B11.06
MARKAAVKKLLRKPSLKPAEKVRRDSSSEEEADSIDVSANLKQYKPSADLALSEESDSEIEIPSFGTADDNEHESEEPVVFAKQREDEDDQIAYLGSEKDGDDDGDAKVDGLLHEMSEKLGEVENNFPIVIERSKLSAELRESGVSYLDLKADLMLSYLTQLVFSMLLQVEGQSVKNHRIVEDLIRTRVILEKLRPVEGKLKYQINKLIKMASDAAAGLKPSSNEENDVLSLKPKPENFTMDDDEANDILGDDAKYEAPKFASVDLESRTDKQKKKDEQKAMKLARSSSMLRALREELSEAPVAAKSIGAEFDVDESEDERERRDFEEDTFTRLAVSRKDKLKRKEKQKKAGFGDAFDDFGDFKDLEILQSLANKSERIEREEAVREEAYKTAFKQMSKEKDRKRSLAAKDGPAFKKRRVTQS